MSFLKIKVIPFHASLAVFHVCYLPPGVLLPALSSHLFHLCLNCVVLCFKDCFLCGIIVVLQIVRLLCQLERVMMAAG